MKAGTKEYYAAYYTQNKSEHNTKATKWKAENKSKALESVKKWQSKNADKVREWHRLKKQQQVKERREFIDNYKSTCSCKKCGENRFYVLDFHHTDPSQKVFNLGSASKYSITKLKMELEKCITLCRNCHSEFHFFEKERGITINDFLTNVAE